MRRLRSSGPRHRVAAGLLAMATAFLAVAEAAAATTTRTVAFTAETFITDSERTLLNGETKSALTIMGVAEAPDSISGTFSFVEPTPVVSSFVSSSGISRTFELTGMSVTVGSETFVYPTSASAFRRLILTDSTSPLGQDRIEAFVLGAPTDEELQLADGTLDQIELDGTYETSDALDGLDTVPSTAAFGSPFSDDNEVQIFVNDRNGNSFRLGYKDVTISDPSGGSTAMTPIPLPATGLMLAGAVAGLGAVRRRR